MMFSVLVIKTFGVETTDWNVAKKVAWLLEETP